MTQRKGERAWSRRDLLRVGGLGALGLTLPRLLRAEQNQSRDREGAQSGVAGGATRRSAKRCILFFLEGGPSHIDLWDMKPEAPAEVRGIFQPIATSVPGVQVCEHLDQWAPLMHHLALVRSVTHSIVDHNAGSYYALTGRYPVTGGQLIQSPRPENFPPFGSVLAKLRPSGRALPDFVHVPEIMSNLGYDLPGQRAGFFGAAYDPFVTGDPSVPGYTVPGLERPAELSLNRLDRRRSLFEQVDRALGEAGQGREFARMDAFYEKAFSLVTSSGARQAFDLSREPRALRERYGIYEGHDRSKGAREFGGLPQLGQCMLLARRLIEAGVRLVTVCTGHKYDQSWDTHRQHFPLLTRSLLPYANRAFAALLEDLQQRGLLDDTLVVAMGEFGRTPKLGQITSDAGADANGRDHWPHCYTVMFAGAGIRGGTVYGASDRFAAYPAKDPVGPEDVAATVYAALGIDAETRIEDPLHRPQAVALGKPIGELFG